VDAVARQPAAAAEYDESYFVGGSKSNYDDYGAVEQAIDAGFMPVVRRYASAAGAGRNSRAYLDVGCAFGYYVKRLGEVGWDAAGVDVSRYAIERGRARGIEGITVAPAQDLPFPDDSFDFVTAIDLIEHVPSEEAGLVVAEVRRVLRPGGLTLFATPNFLSNAYWNVYTPGFEDPDLTHINYQSVESLRVLFAEFSSCRVYGHTPFLEQFRAFDVAGVLPAPLHRIGPIRERARRVMWKLLGQSVDYSSYLHAVAVK
jgi:SAM-dependent methyltransferase